MNRKQHSSNFWLVLAIIVMGTLLLTWLSVSPQAGADLPSRDTPTPAPAGKDNDAARVGAHIELHIPGAPAGAWSVVQWQDSAGDWRDVEGWRGTLDATGRRRWWVAAKDFDTGPFRWIVTRGPNGATLGTSEPFNLPGGANETLLIEISVGQ